MGMVVRTNYSALNATRHLNKNSAGLSNSLEKLASGFKINKSADDASGLAISEKMKAQIKALDTASANCEDGISMIQTTEGYLTEVHDMLNRMVELSEKSANGTYETVDGGANAGTVGNAGTDRDALQAEMDQLCAEVDRIAATANFNNVKLFNGELSTENYSKITSLTNSQTVGFKAAAAGSGVPTGFDTTKISTSSDFQLEGNLSSKYVDGDLELTLKTNDGTTYSQTIKDVAASTSYSLQDGALAGLTITTNATFAGGTAATTDGTIGLLQKNAPTAAAAPSDVDDLFGETEANILNAAGITDIKGLGAIAESGDEISITYDSTSAGSISITVGDKTYSASSITVNGDNALKSTDGDAIFVTVGATFSGNGTFKGEFKMNDDSGVAVTELAKAGDGLTLQIGETSNAADKLTVGVSRLHTDTLLAGVTSYTNADGSQNVRLAVNKENTVKGVTGYTVDISGQQRASAAAEALRSVINDVSSQRASLGAMQNRLDYTVNNLNTASENVTSANSRIRDTDMAKEMTKYTQMNVLSQAAQAMLAQANQQPSSVLQLLQ